jgi:hypothetical protein
VSGRNAAANPTPPAADAAGAPRRLASDPGSLRRVRSDRVRASLRAVEGQSGAYTGGGGDDLLQEGGRRVGGKGCVLDRFPKLARLCVHVKAHKLAWYTAGVTTVTLLTLTCDRLA